MEVMVEDEPEAKDGSGGQDASRSGGTLNRGKGGRGGVTNWS